MTRPTDPALAFEAILAADVGAFDAGRASQALAEARLVRGVLDVFEAAVTTRLGELYDRGQSAPATDLHTRNGGVSAREAQRKQRRAKALEQAPAVADSLRNGTIGAEHADALANATIRLDDEVQAAFFDRDADLAADAARMTPEEFGKNCRDLVRLLERDAGVERQQRQRRETRLDKKVDHDGMYVLNARLHPELGNAVFNAIDAETAALVKAGGDRSADRSQVAADALGNLVVGGHQAKRSTEAEIRIHVDEQTASSGKLHEHSVCEFDDGTPIPPASMLRLLCNGLIIPIIVDSGGNVLNVGREQRVANRSQRRALRAMYRTCAFHGCDVAFNRCEIHHIEEWELNGPTDLDNLLPLCSRHHHLVHEQRWQLDLGPDRALTIRQSDGSIFARSRPDVPGKPAPPPPGQQSPDGRSRPKQLVA